MIVSPWLIWHKLEETGFLASMKRALSRGIDITVVTDKSFNTQASSYDQRIEKRQRLDEALGKLEELGISTRLVDRIHSKVVIGDEGLLCVGSFNWFSASRDENFKRYDTSMVYVGDALKNEIKIIYSNLEQRILKKI